MTLTPTKADLLKDFLLPLNPEELIESLKILMQTMAIKTGETAPIQLILQSMTISELLQALTLIQEAINDLSGSPYETLMDLKISQSSPPPSPAQGESSGNGETRI